MKHDAGHEAILRALLENAGHPMTQDQIVDSVLEMAKTDPELATFLETQEQIIDSVLEMESET